MVPFAQRPLCTSERPRLGQQVSYVEMNVAIFVRWLLRPLSHSLFRCPGQHDHRLAGQLADLLAGWLAGWLAG